ncbi:DUF418 domain-containing protein [Nocardiopsis coralliicola]
MDDHSPGRAAAAAPPGAAPGAAPMRGPTRDTERSLAPDLARGAMLLLIALANTPFYLWGRAHSIAGFHPLDGGVLDRIVQATLIIGVDLRVYPMFAFLFGYGMMQILQRQRAAGVSERAARALLRRRNLWLLAFGAVHALLLWVGDVLGAYGFAGLVIAALFIRRSDRTLLVWAGIGTGLLALFALLGTAGAWAVAVYAPNTPAEAAPAIMTASASETDPFAAALLRITTWPMLAAVQGVFGLASPVAIILAFWAARRRILEEPWNHLRLLRWTAAIGIGTAWATGLPHALHHVGLYDIPEGASWVFATTQLPTGLAGGIGYVALFGLIAARLRNRPPGLARRASVAVGKRSMSAYLAQSVLCAPVLAGWGLGLGASMGSWTMAAYALAVWLVTAAGCLALERAGRRGPAETALRRLAYRSAPVGAGTTR